MADAVWLLIRGVHPTLWAYRIRRRPQSVGRSPRCDIQVVHDTVSRQHAQVWISSDEIFIRDLKSRNGTFIGGSRVNQSRLAAGDSIQLGEVTLDLVQGSRDELRPSDAADSTTIYYKPMTGIAVEADVTVLSDGQRQVLHLLLQGLSEKQAAARLCISPHTVHAHAKRIYKELGVKSRAELFAKFLSGATRIVLD